MITMHTKRLPITPRNTIVDHKVIWNTVAPSGWWRYVDDPGVVDCVKLAAVVFAKGVLREVLRYMSSMVFLVSYLPELEDWGERHRM